MWRVGRGRGQTVAPGGVSELSRRLLNALTLALAASAAEAQVTVGQRPYGLTLEGFANVTAGCDAGSDAP